jgi:hypothetical protein
MTCNEGREGALAYSRHKETTWRKESLSADGVRGYGDGDIDVESEG